MVAVRGDEIVRKGDRATAMYIIKRGSLSVFVKTDDNRVDQIATLGVGDYFGDQALLRRGLRTASISNAKHGPFLHYVGRRASPDAQLPERQDEDPPKHETRDFGDEEVTAGVASGSRM